MSANLPHEWDLRDLVNEVDRLRTELERVQRPTPTGPTLDHANYLGASDIGVIVGENHLARDQSDVWGEKKGYLHFEGTVETDLGNEVERPVLAVWAKWQGADLAFPGTFIHPDEPWAGATVDAIRDERISVEFKFVGRQMALEWGPAHLGADGVPAVVICQLHWQTWVLRANGFTIERGQVVACLGTELRTYDVEIDEDLIALLVEQGRTWWVRHVIGDERPEGRAGRELVAAIHPANVRPQLEPMTDEVRDLAIPYDKARGDEKAAKAEKELLYPQLCDLVGDGSGFEGDGVKVTWKANVHGKRSLNVRIKAEK